MSRKEDAGKPSQAPPNPAARNVQKLHLQDKRLASSGCHYSDVCRTG